MHGPKNKKWWELGRGFGWQRNDQWWGCVKAQFGSRCHKKKTNVADRLSGNLAALFVSAVINKKAAVTLVLKIKVSRSYYWFCHSMACCMSGRQ